MHRVARHGVRAGLLGVRQRGWVHDSRIVGPAHLIPLKARAWLDLRARKEAGEEVDSRAIQKHKNDVFRLFQVIDPESDVKPPRRIVDDMGAFLDQVAVEGADLKALGLRTTSLGTVMDGLRKLYRVDLSHPRASKA